LPESWLYEDVLYGNSYTITSTGIFLSTIIGLAAGVLIGLITEYYTGFGKPPVRRIASNH
jgi:K(+)-stimulated pyrophosphate-energized sodium pump